ncbi:hypothetical protein TTHERM_01087880 (macronuclear) [Tetrahymena thermophila SB210]|uniref:Uncharacterized protein n=1 Tax=Tetrahymena thermophila (strain SB210) TaxID=312017 RepID=Q23M78_TETTS|nr:hypothetical protein TTHERM_01087880 [Tetrahymena thermophila SB210]EAR97635.1 hypothetical protein TTHERM_01087880 [Tetrahymena thermophila SB210]|eukprot:XP_001017880.1 hypothetical protein TTHERM_01087880 [Tetrahymena thermophila SB210]
MRIIIYYHEQKFNIKMLQQQHLATSQQVERDQFQYRCTQKNCRFNENNKIPFKKWWLGQVGLYESNILL